MKKSIKICIFTFILSLFAIFSSFNFKQSTNVYAANLTDNIMTTISYVLSDYTEFDERIAGSEDEKSASEYIVNFLNSSNNAIPFVNKSIKNGIQEFRFQSIFDGNYYSSQNIIYQIPAKTETNKRVILMCSYDAFAYKVNSKTGAMSLDSTEGLNQSAGSVAILLAMAQYFPKNYYDFNIQFIFFGAGSSNNAGSEFYTKGISEDDAKNILLAINFDSISFGKNLYFYVDEIENDFSNFASKLYNSGETDIEEISIAKLGKILVDDNGMGLNYTHIAQTSNNINFMKSKVLTMNVFSGDYSSGITIGRCEFENVELITFTKNDNLEYINANFGLETISENLINVYNSILTLISNDNFVSACSASFCQSKTFYRFFGDNNLVIILTAVCFLLFVIVGLAIHYKLTVKSYNADIEDDFVAVVLNMTANVDNKKGSDSEISKNISEIVASDIKKDKRIRRKK